MLFIIDGSANPTKKTESTANQMKKTVNQLYD